MLYASGHEADDVLQDVFLRVHSRLARRRACRSSRVPGCCGSSTTPVSTSCAARAPAPSVTSSSTACPPCSAPAARRARPTAAEARALLGDIHRLPDRQKLGAGDERDRRALARGGRGPAGHDRRDDPLAAGAGAREPAPHRRGARDRVLSAVCDALDEAASGGRARERDRPPAPVELRRTAARYQRDLRAPRPRACAGWRAGARGASSRSCSAAAGSRGVQKVAAGACCALVVGGGAVAVPEVVEHARDASRARRRRVGDGHAGGHRRGGQAVRAGRSASTTPPPVERLHVHAGRRPDAAHTTETSPAARTKTPRRRPRRRRPDRPPTIARRRTELRQYSEIASAHFLEAATRPRPSARSSFARCSQVHASSPPARRQRRNALLKLSARGVRSRRQRRRRRRASVPAPDADRHARSRSRRRRPRRSDAGADPDRHGGPGPDPGGHAGPHRDARGRPRRPSDPGRHALKSRCGERRAALPRSR